MWHTDKDSIMSKTDNNTALPTIAIDGSFGEGGGQIIRTSVSLAAITGRAVEIVNIRARRSKPGLQAQHLTSVRAAGALCDATLYGAELGSQFLRFLPNAPVAADTFRFDVAEARGGASAGATGLVAETLLVPLAFMPAFTSWFGAVIRATILGGTHVPMSPTADYIEGAYLPLLRRLGLDAEMRSMRAGFFPRGGGEIALHLRGGGLNTPLDLTERGRLQTLRAFVTTSQLPEHVADRAEDVLRKELKGYGVPVQVEKRNLDSNGAGAAVVLDCRVSKRARRLGVIGRTGQADGKSRVRRHTRLPGLASGQCGDGRASGRPTGAAVRPDSRRKPLDNAACHRPSAHCPVCGAAVPTY